MTTSGYKELWATSEKKETNAISLDQQDIRGMELFTSAAITADVQCVKSVFREANKLAVQAG